MKKTVSLLLSVLLTFGVIFTAIDLSGITAEAASHSSTARNEIWMIVEDERALIRNTATDFDNAPLMVDEVVYLPITMVCAYAGATASQIGSKVEISLKNGTRVTLNAGSKAWNNGSDDLLLNYAALEADSCLYLCVDDTEAVFGLNSFFNPSINLIVLSEGSLSYTTGYGSLSVQIKTLCALLFDRPSGAKVVSDVANGIGLGTHPRIMVDQNRFDLLRRIYEGEQLEGYDPLFTTWLTSFCYKGETAFKSLFDFDDDGTVVWASQSVKDSVRQPYYIYDVQGNRLVGTRSYTYVNDKGETVTVTPGGSELGDGYDEGGRSNVDNHTKKLKYLAFAWQMTGDDKYADAFYLLAKELGKWEHWGEGHFLDCADGSVEFAIGFDWIYHAFDDEPEKRKEMADVLYRLGLMMGYYSVMGERSKIHYSSKAGGCWDIKFWDNNWQTVCGSGMVVSALVLAEYDEFRPNCEVVINSCISTLENCLMSYAPDGGYIESPGYWSYGTNTLVVMLAALISSCGTDYGYLDIIGLHDSFYFANYITTSELAAWNFHDGGKSVVDRQTYFFASKFYSDPSLAAFREYMLKERNVSYDVMDILYYDPKLSEGAGEFDLDFSSESIQTVTMRSGWESGSTFTGLHVGPNNVSHGDVDCGNIYLEMGGVTWIGDQGSENYNIGGYWDMSQNGLRHRYYRKTLEAHTCIIIKSTDPKLSRGQIYNSFSNNYAKIVDYSSEENGAYAIANMTPQYGVECIEAKRGLLFTNSRTTVVLQDDIRFSSPTNLIWTCPLKNVVEMSEDGRTVLARMYSGSEPVTLRATLLTDDSTIRFRYSTANETLISDTIIRANSTNERASNPEKRIVIEANGKTEFHVAVVFELIRDSAEVVGYTYTDMANWSPVSDEWVTEANKDIVYPEETVKPKYGVSNFVSAIAKINKATTLAERGEIIEKTMICLTDYDKDNAKTQAKVDEFMTYVDQYNKDVAALNATYEAFFFGWLPSSSKHFGS